MYQVVSASDGAHTLVVRNADVLEAVFNSSIGAMGSLPKNLAELRFALELRVTVC